MNKDKKISIITVTKNSEKFLEECILSVHNQFYKNYEHIIIDGNSKDNTLGIIEKHKETNISKNTPSTSLISDGNFLYIECVPEAYSVSVPL